MRFVKFIVCNVLPDRKYNPQYSEYINVKKIKSFHVGKDPDGKKGLQLNDSQDKCFRDYRYIPADEDQFKEAFGLDWDEL